MMPQHVTPEERWNTPDQRLKRIETMMHVLCMYVGINPLTREPVKPGTIMEWQRRDTNVRG